MRKNKLLLLIVLLLTAATGAWAQGPVDGTIVWPIGDEGSATVSASIKDAISSTSVTTGSGLTVGSSIYFDTNMVKYTPTTANAGNVEGVMIEYRIEAVDGYKFKPTGVDYAAVKVGNDNLSYSWSYTIDGVESAITDVSYTSVLRSNGGNSATAQLMHSESITADGCSVFTLRFYISNCGTTKNICIGNITISGSVSAAAASGYTVSLKDGVKDADKWTVKVGEGQAQALPIGGLKGDGSETVTLQYNGRLKVKGVKATSDAAPAEATPALSINSPSVGQVIGSDGKNYAAANVPSGVDKVAMIAYVSGSNGLAIALADEGCMNWNTALSTAAAHTPVFSNGTWKLPSQDEWKQMFSANGGNEESYDGLNTAITTAGGTAFQDGTVDYWSSSENDSDKASLAQFYYGYPLWFNDWKVNDQWVRACLAFTVEPAAKPAATVTTAPTAKTGVKADQNVAIVNAGTATGGTMMYKVTTANTKPTSTDGFSATVPTAEGLTAGTYYVWYYIQADDSHTDSEISATGIEVTIAAAETTITWTTADMTSNFYAQFDGWSYNNTHQGITVTASGDGMGGWSQNNIDVMNGSGTITFTSSVGNIKSIVITAVSLNDINEMNTPTGWTANEMWNEPRTLSWSGTASATVNLPLSNMQYIGDISTIVFTLE